MEKEPSADLTTTCLAPTPSITRSPAPPATRCSICSGASLRVLYSDQLTGKGLFPKEARPEVRSTHKEIGEAILAGEGEHAETMMKKHMADLARLQEEKTPAFMDERVSWEM